MFQRRGWFQSRQVHAHSDAKLHDIGWFTAEGVEMRDEDWSAAKANVLGIFLNGHGIATPDDFGRKVVDDSFYLMFNAHHEPATLQLPDVRWGERWSLIMRTDRGFVSQRTDERAARAHFDLEPWTLAVWQQLEK